MEYFTIHFSIFLQAADEMLYKYLFNSTGYCWHSQLILRIHFIVATLSGFQVWPRAVLERIRPLELVSWRITYVSFVLYAVWRVNKSFFDTQNWFHFTVSPFLFSASPFSVHIDLFNRKLHIGALYICVSSVTWPSFMHRITSEEIDNG